MQLFKTEKGQIGADENEYDEDDREVENEYEEMDTKDGDDNDDNVDDEDDDDDDDDEGGMMRMILNVRMVMMRRLEGEGIVYTD